MNQLVPINTAPPMTVSDVERVALAIAKGGLFGSKDPNAVLTLCLLAQAEGQHPAVVFRDYHIISGKPAKKAEAMLRDFINAGGKVEWHQLDDTCADATFTHPAGSARIAWDHERAQKAQLAGNAMYKKYPRQMLRSRVISEGIRTVYPGATSGLYEEGEVASFNDPAPTHDAATGEIIESERIEVKEPAAREKLDGPHTSKTALRKAVSDIITAVRKAETAEAIDALKSDNRQTINQALRDWPALVDGDPNVPEDIGLKGEIEKRRGEVTRSTEYQFLVSLVEECTSKNELDAFVAKHGEAVETLDGEESREFQALYDRKEAALKLLATSEA